MNLDEITLNFSEERLTLLNICLGFMMFGVSLELKIEDFRNLLRTPRSALVGLISQFILLPMATFVFLYFANLQASVAMGLLLVAACPGGNISNFLSALAKGNVALSVSLTAVGTLISGVMTPFNFLFWNQFLHHQSTIPNLSIDTWSMVKTTLYLLAFPLVLGMGFARFFPVLTQKILKPLKFISILLLAVFIIMALKSNWNIFVEHIQQVVWLVLIHNGLALGVGYWFSKVMRLDERDCRTVSIETGIQNSGLGLVLIFNFFNGLGGMALIAAWWGIWHMISGGVIAWYWSKK